MHPSNLPPFHLACFVSDLKAARHFFQTILGCQKGRETENWVDFDFFGHQLSLHQGPLDKNIISKGNVDNTDVPIPHFGVILTWPISNKLIKQIKAHNVIFRLEPHVCFKGKSGEQGTFFIDGPGGISLEFKAFKYPDAIFSHS